MGKVLADIEVTNGEDLVLLRKGLIKSEQVRVVRTKALVDTGATLLSMPEDLLDQLGLPVVRRGKNTYADGRQEWRNIHGMALLRVAERTCYVEVVSGHSGRPTFLGQVPLETLDLHVDPKGERLIPNPESPDMPSFRM
jgi:predicted aspartyl protease